jgi:single-strand DNA-binding protein
MRKILIIGHVGQDAVLRYTPTGKPVGNCSVAVNERWTDANGKKQEKTEWFRVEVWDKFAETITPFLKQGREVYVEGIPSADAWNDKGDGSAHGQIRIRAQVVRLLGAKEKEEEPLPIDEEAAVAEELPA